MVNFPKSKWLSNWGIDKLNAQYIDKLIKNIKPEIILETGTFEAQATYVMAQAANSNNNGCVIYTIDYDGDPTSERPIEEWLLLKKLRNENLEKIKINFKNVTVKFLEGDSRIVLKDLFTNENIEKVDLFLQDSMHFIEGIQSEWKLVENYIKTGSYTIFDDVKLKGVQAFKKWFMKEYGDKYQYFHENYGHKQLVVKKL